MSYASNGRSFALRSRLSFTACQFAEHRPRQPRSDLRYVKRVVQQEDPTPCNFERVKLEGITQWSWSPTGPPSSTTRIHQYHTFRLQDLDMAKPLQGSIRSQCGRCLIFETFHSGCA